MSPEVIDRVVDRRLLDLLSNHLLLHRLIFDHILSAIIYVNID
jgi:hypothetical protein